MNEPNICAGGAVTEQELAAIAQYSRRPLTAEEVYTFPLVLCDNDLDRDNECFTDAALEKLEAIAATAATGGRVECWHCTACDKYFADANGQTEITL